MTPARRRIRVLPEHLANKIAAGEVIQRPESVVKELLENSLDALAREILLVIKDGGKTLIKVADDGVGMDEEDALTSFLRHATSKIASYEELEGVNTYGFRGEALASIAAVAQVTLATRRADDEMAVVVRMDGGGEQQLSREARQPGTTVTVQNLFYNVPARRKFLRSTTTEFRHVSDAVQRIALSHPEVAVKFISDDNVILDLRPAPLRDRVRDLFGERMLEGIVRLAEESDFVSVSGFIGKPHFGQKTRAHQYVFLNRRFITNRTITHAVFSAYENMMVKGTFPFFLLFIDLDPHRVDVNVHPSKMEAKFEDEQGIYRFVSTLVRKTLADHDLVPSLSTAPPAGEEIRLRFTDRQHTPQPLFSTDGRPSQLQAGGAAVAGALLRPEGASTESPDATPPPVDAPVWQVHNKYILVQVGTGIMVIDQHVAHERVLYERALARLAGGMPVSQQLLFPRTIPLTSPEYAVVKELEADLGMIGFSVKPFGKDTVLIEGAPPDLPSGTETAVLREMIDLYREYERVAQTERRDNLAKSYSCKAAIKAGDPLTDAEMRALLSQLFATNMPYVCPHGRPVVLKISVAELDRRFGRS